MGNIEKIEFNKIYIPSDKVVARQIEDELIIVPIESGTFNAEFDYALYSLKSTGKDIWERLDKKITIKKICSELSEEYDAPENIIKKDVINLLDELFSKGIIVELNKK